MEHFWEEIIHPVLQALQPQCIVEVGAGKGHLTRVLARFAHQHGTLLHAIDPRPDFDTATFDFEAGTGVSFHRGTSLQVLPRIPFYDAVLLGGDPNWYTVYHELQTIETYCDLGQVRFPFVFLSNVGWPYGQRDGYFDPDRIPPTYRQPFDTIGVPLTDDPARSDEVYRPGRPHATAAGTPRNGVRTAVDDFIRESDRALQYLHLPGFHGLGLLFPKQLRVERPTLDTLLRAWDLPKRTLAYLERLEENRLRYQLLATSQRERFREARRALRAEIARQQRPEASPGEAAHPNPKTDGNINSA